MNQDPQDPVTASEHSTVDSPVTASPSEPASKPHREGITILYAPQPADGSPIRMTALNYIPPLERLMATVSAAIATAELNAGRDGSGVAFLGLLVSDPRLYLEIFEENGKPDTELDYIPRFPDLTNWVTLAQPAIKPLNPGLDLDEGEE